jgi:SRSO17 transposase
VGVAPQYCGALGQRANGQVVVTTTYCDPAWSWPVNGQVYLPETWIADAARRKRARIPPSIPFRTKPELALALIDQAREGGVPFDLVVTDGGYGDNPNFLDGLAERRLHGVVGIHRDFGVRRPAEVVEAAARPVPSRKRPGRPRSHPHPVQVAPLHRADAMLAAQPADAWRTITWREGSAGPLGKRFVAVRVHRAVRDATGPLGWLIGERPLPDADGEEKLYWSDLPEDTPLARLAELAHRRPSVERGYEDGKGLTGLGVYAARTWDSFHRHLVIEFLVLSWLALQAPPVDLRPLAPEPLPPSPTAEPIFPLRTPPLPEPRPRPPPGLRLPVRRAPPLARPLRPTRPQRAPRAGPVHRLPDPLPRPVASP